MNYFICAIKQVCRFHRQGQKKRILVLYSLHCILAIVAAILDNVFHLTPSTPYAYTGIIFTLLSLGLFIPSLAVLVRRLHDIDKAWPRMFISFIPLVGWIWLLILLCTPGSQGPNRFGPDPKAQP